jgi:hypothetical protein
MKLFLFKNESILIIMDNIIKKEETNEKLLNLIESYKMEIYKKNMIIKQLQDKIFLEEQIKKNILSKL